MHSGKTSDDKPTHKVTRVWSQKKKEANLTKPSSCVPGTYSDTMYHTMLLMGGSTEEEILEYSWYWFIETISNESMFWIQWNCAQPKIKF